jgi:PDZ domain
MNRLIQITLLMVMISGCVTPSTMLVNSEGKIIRSYGYGTGIAGAIAIGTAQQMHDTCVNDAILIGFIPIPKAGFGFHADLKTNPLKIIEVGENARSAGMLVGDLLLEVDSIPVAHYFTSLRFLNTKKPGDNVTVKIQRDREVLGLNFRLVTREAGLSQISLKQPESASPPVSVPVVTPQTMSEAPPSPLKSLEVTTPPPQPTSIGVGKSMAQLYLVKGPIVSNPPQIFNGEFLPTGKAQVTLSGRRLLTGDFELFGIADSIKAKYKPALVNPDNLKLSIGADAKGFAALNDGSGTQLECVYSLTKATGRGEGTCADNQRNTYRIVFD